MHDSEEIKAKEDLRSGWHDRYPWLDADISCGTGWDVLLDQLFKLLDSSWGRMKEPEEERFSVVQVKEKFGTLRVYTLGKHPQETDGMIQMAESMSGVICEGCGAPGSMTKKGSWFMTRCESCQ